MLLLQFVPLVGGHLDPVGTLGGGGVLVEGAGCDGGVRTPLPPSNLNFLLVSGEFPSFDDADGDAAAGRVDGGGGGGGGRTGPGSRGRGGGDDGKSVLGAMDQLLKLNFVGLAETRCCWSAARSFMGSTTPSC